MKDEENAVQACAVICYSSLFILYPSCLNSIPFILPPSSFILAFQGNEHGEKNSNCG